MLDFGCGDAPNARAFKHYIGIDISKRLLKKAMRGAPNAIFICDDHVSFKGRVDAVLCHGVLQYLSLERFEMIMNEFDRISKRILITDIPDVERATERELERSKKHDGNLQHRYYSKLEFKERGYEIVSHDFKSNNYSTQEWYFDAVRR